MSQAQLFDTCGNTLTYAFLRAAPSISGDAELEQMCSNLHQKLSQRTLNADLSTQFGVDPVKKVLDGLLDVSSCLRWHLQQALCRNESERKELVDCKSLTHFAKILEEYSTRISCPAQITDTVLLEWLVGHLDEDGTLKRAGQSRAQPAFNAAEAGTRQSK